METQTYDDAGDADFSVPIAFCRALKRRTPEGTAWELAVDKCPLCSLKHAYAGGTGPRPTYGDRMSHCADRNVRSVYRLRPADGAR